MLRMRSFSQTRVIALGLILAIQSVLVPVSAAPQDLGSISGTVFSGQDRTPLANATVHVGDPRSGQMFLSDPTTKDGKFSVERLPGSTYEVAVELNGGLYPVASPLELGTGQSQTLDLAVRKDTDGESNGTKGKAKNQKGVDKPKLWNNPLMATLVIVGSAIGVGMIVEATGDDSGEASPFSN